MNGIVVRGGPDDEEQIARLVRFVKRPYGRRGWRRREYVRLASEFDPLADIPLRIWQSAWPPGEQASIDAFERLLRGEADAGD